MPVFTNESSHFCKCLANRTLLSWNEDTLLLNKFSLQAHINKYDNTFRLLLCCKVEFFLFNKISSITAGHENNRLTGWGSKVAGYLRGRVGTEKFECISKYLF